MGEQILKATEITDAKITFVSLVNKAANKRTFLITKAEKGSAQFQTDGAILMSDSQTHYITGVVYEPDTEDAQGNFMTDKEIAKAEKYFSEKCNQVDVQHSFESCDGASVVDSWIEKCDCTINEQPVKKGSWLMTIKVEDEELWQKVEKGEITGLSMGGTGKYSNVDVSLEKTGESKEGLFVKLAKALGYDVVKKGAVRDTFNERKKDTNFWQAYSSFESTLKHYDSSKGRYVYEDDPEIVRDALSDFCDIITEVLSTETGVQKAVIDKSPEDDLEGKKPQKKSNKSKEEEDMEKIKKSELEQLISEAVAEEVKKCAGESENTPKDDEGNEEITKADIAEIVKSAVASEIKKHGFVRGVSNSLDIEEEEIEKADEEVHYLHGIL